MTYRRKLPKKRRTPRSNIEILQDEIDEITRQEQRIEMELQDVLTDVTTPENSDTEDELNAIPINAADLGQNEPNYEAAQEQLGEFLAARVTPTSEVPFSTLYSNPQYVRNAKRKLKKLKRIARRANFGKAFSEKRFWRQYSRVRDLYPHHGGREDLNGLVALYCYVQDLDNEEEETSDDESEPSLSESEKPEDKSDDDDDERGGGKVRLIESTGGDVAPIRV